MLRIFPPAFFIVATFCTISSFGSCGGPPDWEILDTLPDGGYVVGTENGSTKYPVDTTHLADLLKAIGSVVLPHPHIAVATVISAKCSVLCDSFCLYPPAICTVTVTISEVLRGDFVKTQQVAFEARSISDGSLSFYGNFPGESFLLYSDSLPATELTIGPGCYSSARGFFVKDGLVSSPGIAFGQSVPLEGLLRSSVRSARDSRRLGSAGEGLRPRVLSLSRRPFPATQRAFDLTGRQSIGGWRGVGIVLVPQR